MPVELHRGDLKLSGSSLFFDAKKKAPLSFISHAHSDHIARHHRVIATPETLALTQHRLGPLEATVPLRYHEPWTLDGATLELFPAGHVLGSAQLRVTRADGHRLVYTGDLGVGPTLTASQAEAVPCDTLVLESTFGHPRYRFPPRAEVFDAVAAWARGEFAKGRHPIIYAYSLGKGQEAIAQLAARGLELCAHATIHAVSEVYSAHGVPVAARCFDGTLRDHEVGVFPPYGRSQDLKHLPNRSTAVLTGWALEPWAARRYGADVAFAISDHADCEALVSAAVASGAREVITVHGFAEELAKTLRARGIFARPATKAVQLGFGFG